jgi:hypothetical protein
LIEKVFLKKLFLKFDIKRNYENILMRLKWNKKIEDDLSFKEIILKKICFKINLIISKIKILVMV